MEHVKKWRVALYNFLRPVVASRNSTMYSEKLGIKPFESDTSCPLRIDPEVIEKMDQLQFIDLLW